MHISELTISSEWSNLKTLSLGFVTDADVQSLTRSTFKKQQRNIGLLLTHFQANITTKLMFRSWNMQIQCGDNINKVISKR